MVREADLLAFVARRLPPRILGPAASDVTGRVPGAEVPVIERLEALELLGVAPVGTTIGQLLFGASSDPGGLFDYPSETVYVRRGSLKDEEDVLAHELTHALEFQHLLHGAQVSPSSSFDALEAQRALVEGPAVLVQYLYAQRYLGFTGDLRMFLARFERQAVREVPLPRFLLAESLFPYIDGTLFVDGVLRARGWAGVTAIERNPPVSTQAIIDAPFPRAVALAINSRGVLGAGWQAEPLQSIGALDTAQLLAPGALEAQAALLRTWRGGSFQLWQNLATAGVQRCKRPCAAHYILVARWAWSTPAAASHAADTLRQTLGSLLRTSTSPTKGVLSTRLGSAASIISAGRTAVAVISPDAAITLALAADNR